MPMRLLITPLFAELLFFCRHTAAARQPHCHRRDDDAYLRAGHYDASATDWSHLFLHFAF